MKNRFTAIIVCVVLLLGVIALPAQAAGGEDRTYTVNADFDEGILTGVEHDSVPDQLQLSGESVVLPFIWVPNSNEGTVSKYDTVTGKELARYRTGPTSGGNPSRTTVDQEGDVWFGNRNTGTVVKIGLYEAGHWVDKNGDGVCQTSTDLNNDGKVTGAEVLPWGQDECVLFEVLCGSTGSGPRGIAIDANNDLWAGTYNSPYKFYHIDGDTGTIITADTIDIAPHGGSYGAVVDSDGYLWSSMLRSYVLKIDPVTKNITRVNLSITSYGLGIDGDGHLFVAAWGQSNIAKIDMATASVIKYGYQGATHTRGLCVTDDGDVWAVNSLETKVTRLDNDLHIKATIDIGTSGYSTGAAVDAAGKVWACNFTDGGLLRIDPTTDAIDLSIYTPGISGTGVGQHYSYSDMTGIISKNITTKTGVWKVVHDSGAADTAWNSVSWTADTPQDTSVTVNVRSSNDQVTWSAWETAGNGAALTATPAGRYLEIETTLKITSGDVSPVLYDLTVDGTPANTPPIAALVVNPYPSTENFPVDLDASGSSDPDGDPLQFRWDLDGDGTWDTDYASKMVYDGFVNCDDYAGTVAVEVSDGLATDVATADVLFENLPPTIDVLSYSPEDVQCKDQPIEFTGIGKDPGCDDLTVTWEFGDGESEEYAFFANFESIVTHTYGEFGEYTVKLTVADDDGGEAIQKITVTVKDTTPPELLGQCVESVNPHGNNVPGKNRDKNGKGDQKNVNPDGFYVLDFEAVDNCDPNPTLWVGTADNPQMFQIEPGITVKFTESIDAEPEMKKIGSPAQGGATAVTWHIILPSDPVISAVDASGNIFSCTSCLVPPPPM